jgi:four helix bundle protein
MLNKTTYKDLIVWQKAMDLVTAVYKITVKFPTEEKYGLISQSRRCSVSIPSNIAEGKRRGTDNQFKQFLLIAFGSASELETQIEIAKRLNFAKPDDYKEVDSLLNEVLKMLNKLIGLQ